MAPQKPLRKLQPGPLQSRIGSAILGAAVIDDVIGVIVLTASRTGMVGMAFLCLWGLLDRSLPRKLRERELAS